MFLESAVSNFVPGRGETARRRVQSFIDAHTASAPLRCSIAASGAVSFLRLFVCLPVLGVQFVVPSSFAQSPAIGIAPMQLTQGESLQAVIDRGGPLVFVPKGSYTLSETLHLRSDLILHFEPGTVIEAAEGAFKGVEDCLIVAAKCRNVTFNADGAIFRMRKADYRDKDKYADSEFRHALGIRGCRDVTINGGLYEFSGGDGIYLGPFVEADKRRVPNENIVIRRAVCHENLRQGISVLSAKRPSDGYGLVIEDCQLMNTNGKSPQSGIDIEPEPGDVVDVIVRRCHSESNRGPAYMWSLQHMRPSTPPPRIIFEQCTYANVPPDQPSFRMTGIYSAVAPTGYLEANLPKGTWLQWDTLVLQK